MDICGDSALVCTLMSKRLCSLLVVPAISIFSSTFPFPEQFRGMDDSDEELEVIDEVARRDSHSHRPVVHATKNHMHISSKI
jgi:hypothetical protein